MIKDINFLRLGRTAEDALHLFNGGGQIGAFFLLGRLEGEIQYELDGVIRMANSYVGLA